MKHRHTPDRREFLSDEAHRLAQVESRRLSRRAMITAAVVLFAIAAAAFAVFVQ